MSVVAAVVGVAAAAVALLRWLRVAQREHYIAGSCTTVTRRWLAARPTNIGIAAGADLGLVAAVALAWAAPLPSAVVTVVAAAGAAVFPVPMTVLGSGPARLRFTRRARTLAVVVAVLSLLVVAACAVTPFWWVGPALAAALMPLVVDLGCAATAPWERRSAERFRTQAAGTLARVGPRVIAVTGSWGKTSTKNHIKDLLTGSVEVVASPASWNNTAGLSRTINEHLTPGAEVLVAEMGMYGPGEIRSLCSWVKPDIAVICAVGPMHLERVGSMEGVVAAKAEILERAATAVLWVGDPRLAALADATEGHARVWRVDWVDADDRAGRDGPDRDRSEAGTADEGPADGGPADGGPADGGPADQGPAESRPVDVGLVDAGEEVAVRHGGAEVGRFAKATGLHPGNVGCAVAAALAAGVDAATLGPRIPHLVNPAHRATAARSDTGVWVVDDTFNANPEGAAAALEALVTAVPTGRRAVVTPGMVELGAEQGPRNRAFARAVAESGATLVVVGRTNRRDLVAGVGGGPVEVVASRDQARAWVRANLADGDGVLWENDLPDHYP